MTEFKLDRWLEIYAARTGGMKSSEVRELLAVTARPDMISFAGGLPDTRLFPVEEIIKATEKIMRQEGQAALQYGPSEGHLGLKEQLRVLMKEEAVEAHHDDFIVTDGAQQALDLIGKVFVDRGDSIILEAPSYVGALQAFSGYQPDFVTVPLDSDGLRIDLLKDKLQGLKASGSRPKFLYTVPNFHNPVGVTLSADRRRELLEVAKDEDLLIIEDNPYGLLRYDGESLPSLRSMDSDVVYISTLSKIFSPGIRLGWVVAPPPILEKIIFAKQAANLCTNSFAQRVAEEYLRADYWRRHVETLIKVYRRRRDGMLAALEEFFPEKSAWTHPEGGIFIWVTLPEYLDTTEMLAEAIQEAKVAYVPGRAFFPDQNGDSQMRLNFSFCEEDVLKKGISMLAKVVKKQMELYPYLTRGLTLGGRSGKGAQTENDGIAADRVSDTVKEKGASTEERELPHGDTGKKNKKRTRKERRDSGL